VPRLKPTPTRTPSPPPAATSTPMVSPSPSHTPKPPPTRTPTVITPTSTAVPTRPPVTLVPPTATASGAPVLSSPEIGRCYGGNVEFSWSWHRGLSNEGPYGGEWFALRVWREDHEKKSIAWVKETSYVLPLVPPDYVGDPNIRYFWNVAVVRQTGPDRSHNWEYVSPESAYCWFCIHSLAPQPPTPTPEPSKPPKPPKPPTPPRP
jgi:hypothetical protein